MEDKNRAVTVRRIIYILLFAGALGYVSVFGGNLPYMIVSLVIINSVIAIIYIYAVFYSVKIIQDIHTHSVLKGNYTEYRFKVVNDGVLSCTNIKFNFINELSTIYGNEGLGHIGLEPRQCIQRPLELVCNYSGTYFAGVDSIEIMDYFGIFKVKFDMPQKMKVVVHPRIIEINSLPFMDDNDDSVMSSQYMNIDMAVDSQVREYNAGDSVNMIHWKNSAKYNKLMVRTYAEEETMDYIVILDGIIDSSEYIERIITADKIRETSIAIINYLYKCGCNISFAINTCDVKNIYSKSDFNIVYDAVSAYSFTTGTHFINASDCNHTSWNNNAVVIIVSANIKDSQASKLSDTVVWINVNEFKSVDEFFSVKE